MIIPLLGYYEFLTHRNVMVDMPTHHDPLEKVPLDGVVSVVKKDRIAYAGRNMGIDDSCICRERHSPWSRHMYIVKAPTFQHLYTNIKSKLKDLPKWPSLWALASMVCQATLSITS